MQIIKFIIRFILLLIFFPIFWFIYGVYAYIRILFTYDTLNIYFDDFIEFIDFTMFNKDK